MNNGFKVKKGLSVIGSGSIIVDVQGSQGQLFSITDSLSGSLFAVSDISGIPIMEVFSNEVVKMGTYGAEALTVSGSQVFLPNFISGSSSDEVLVINTTTKRLETKTAAASSGQSGTSGSSGVSGTSGSSGSRGTSGSSGISGTSGSSGSSATSGSSGISGTSGSSGSSATSGSSGSSATSGSSGSSATSGSSGTSATSGSSGINGTSGSSGSSATSGSSGINGTSGSSGSSATSGSSGISGTSGSSGSAGSSGSRGTSGSSGSSGSSGISGSSGSSGSSGANGTSGSSGTSGTTPNVDPLSEIVISGTQDGSNKTFTMASALNGGTTHQFFINGQLLKYTADYTISSTTLTISADRNAPLSTDVLTLFGSVGTTVVNEVTQEQSIINSLIFG